MMDDAALESEAYLSVSLASRRVRPKCFKCKNLKSEEVPGVSVVQKRKSKAPFLTASPFEAVRDALTGRRSAVRAAAKTRRCDL